MVAACLLPPIGAPLALLHLLGASLTYEAPAHTPFEGLQLQASADNLLDSHVLQHGLLGATGPRFFPAATRSVFFLSCGIDFRNPNCGIQVLCHE
jgi:hypothetical protein